MSESEYAEAARTKVLIEVSKSVMEQTNVRLLPVEAAALEAVRAQRRCSRDRAARDLLSAYVATQAKRAPQDRLTHVTSVLRYPPLPPGRHQPDGRVRVPLRLEPGTSDQIVGLTLRLPGQTSRRGLKHYARSPLAEAICTAVADYHDWEVAGLEGLPKVWTQAAAIGLWRLTVAATLTRPERLAVLGELEDLDTEAEDPTVLTELLRNGDLSWHHPWRDEVSLHLARNLLTGSDEEDHMRMLHEQGDAFNLLRYDLERTDDLDHPYLDGAPLRPTSGVEGRGGALIWRGRRRLALGTVGSWIVAGPNAPLVVSPPRARIAHPSDWVGVRLAAGPELSKAVADDLENRRVLLLSADNQAVVWPYSVDTADPIPWFDLVLQALLKRTPEEIVELVLLDDPSNRTVFLLADEAHDLGFIDGATRDSLVIEAASKTAGRMATILKRAAEWDPDDYAELVASKGDVERFFELAAKHYERPGIVRPWWPWAADSTVQELTDRKHSRARLSKLIEGRARYWKRILEAEMERAGRLAAGRYRVVVDDAAEVYDDEADWGDVTWFDWGDLLE